MESNEKQKAEEFIKNYISICRRWNLDYVNSQSIKSLKASLVQLQWFVPKECALFAVDNLIKSTHSDERANSTLDKEFWIKVKKEIEKL